MEVVEVFETWPEAFRHRQWMTLEAAAAVLVEEEDLKRLLRRAPAFLSSFIIL